MIKKAKKLLLTTLTVLFSFALLAGGTGCNISQDNPEPAVEYTLTVSLETLTLSIFEEGEVKAIAKQDGEIVADAEIEWSSSATSVATVSEGIVVAVSCGNSEITATWQGKTAKCSVVVEDDGIVPELKVSESEIGLQLLMTSNPYKVRPSVFYKDEEHDTSSASFTYSIATEKQSIATVNAEGYVTPVGTGTATLTVSAEWKGYSGAGMQKNIVITVVNDVQTSITGEVNELSLFNGTLGGRSYSNTTTFTATVQLNDEVLANPNIVWHSTKENVAVVENGVITALTKGETEIYYTYNDGEKEYLSDYIKVRTFPVELTLSQNLGEVVLNSNAEEVTTDYVFSYDSFDEQANTVTKAITETGEELRAAYDKTTKKLTIYNNKIEGTADEYIQGVIGPQDGGEYVLTIYTQENVYYTTKINVVSREITTVEGLTAFFDSYKEGALTDDATNVTYGTYVTLGADIENFTRSKAIQTDLQTYFKGTFDGRGHAIKIDQSKEMWYKWGFFGRNVSQDAVIKNTAFIGLLKNSSSGGGLAHVLAGSVDNCYVEITMNGTSNAQGGVCYVCDGIITNTIVNVTASASTNIANKGAICHTNRSKGADLTTCFSIGVTGKIEYSEANTKNAINLVCPKTGEIAADLLKQKIGTALPTSYNSYWTLTDSTLTFGATQLLTFTVSQS